jgi:hypothetical protein
MVSGIKTRRFIRMRRDAIEHRPDGSARRRRENAVHAIGEGEAEVLRAIAEDWIARGVAEVPPTPRRGRGR